MFASKIGTTIHKTVFIIIIRSYKVRAILGKYCKPRSSMLPIIEPFPSNLLIYNHLVTGWWYTYSSEKYESVGIMKLPTEWKNKHVPNHQPGYYWESYETLYISWDDSRFRLSVLPDTLDLGLDGVFFPDVWLSPKEHIKVGKRVELYGIMRSILFLLTYRCCLFYLCWGIPWPFFNDP